MSEPKTLAEKLKAKHHEIGMGHLRYFEIMAEVSCAHFLALVPENQTISEKMNSTRFSIQGYNACADLMRERIISTSSKGRQKSLPPGT